MPRPGTPVVHPRLMASLPADAVPVTVTVQANVPVVAGDGQPVAAWSSIEGLVGLDARMSPWEVEAAGQPQQLRRGAAAGSEADVVTVSTFRVWIGQPCPQVTTAHRIVVAAVPYTIRTVGLDGNGAATVLLVERVE